MPRPPIDLNAKVVSILDHVGDMPQEASSPLAHYTFGANATMNMRRYLVRQIERVEHYQRVRDRHLHVLDNMVLVNLVEAFERFLKDMAAVCIDHLCDRVIDNRFDELSVKGSFFNAHFVGSSPGRALCESDTWLNCNEINERFKKFLRDPPVAPAAPPLPPAAPAFHVFVPHGDEYRMMSIIWQLRHTLVHNVGVLTRSDAAKLKVLARRHLESPRLLLAEWDDVRFLRAYLDQRARDINNRIGIRLAEVLTLLLGGNPALFVAQDEANAISARFGVPLTVAGALGVVPP